MRRAIYAAIFGASLAAGLTGANAQAVSVDWIVGLDDTGSDPVPAGGTIGYHL